MELYIGLMSGTSADGIDAALVDFSNAEPHVIATHYSPYTKEMRANILALCEPGENEIHRLGELDILLGNTFANTVNQLLDKQALSPHSIVAIGSHGHTIRHCPDHHFTLQIGDPNTITAATGITTVADFRRKDVALQGQGAPLVPAFHRHVLASTQVNRIIVNIGGIANITLLPCEPNQAVQGFDTGPGNVLLDSWIHLHQQETFDKEGAWGKQGMANPALLELLLADDYFKLPPPKSTGREQFNLSWLQKQLQILDEKISPQDVQATLVEFTARTIMLAIQSVLPHGEILICGGGAQNAFLLSRLTHLAKPHFTVDTTAKYQIDPDWVEAVAFAWLAKQTLNRAPGNLPSVTGAERETVLGGIYYK